MRKGDPSIPRQSPIYQIGVVVGVTEVGLLLPNTGNTKWVWGSEEIGCPSWVNRGTDLWVTVEMRKCLFHLSLGWVPFYWWWIIYGFDVADPLLWLDGGHKKSTKLIFNASHMVWPSSPIRGKGNREGLRNRILSRLNLMPHYPIATVETIMSLI